MKKILILVCAVVFAASVCNAQEAGQKWLGGSLGFGTSKIKDGARATSYKFLPEFGYQTSDNLGFGISLGYNHSETINQIVSTKSKLNSFTVNPFVRYTFFQNDNLGLFSDFLVGYTHGKYSGTDRKTDEFEVGLRPGIKVNVAGNFAFIAKLGFLGYENTKVSDKVNNEKTSVKGDSFRLNLDMDQFLFGVNYVF